MYCAFTTLYGIPFFHPLSSLFKQTHLPIVAGLAVFLCFDEHIIPFKRNAPACIASQNALNVGKAVQFVLEGVSEIIRLQDHF